MNWAICKYLTNIKESLNEKFNDNKSYLYDGLKILATQTNGFFKFKRMIDNDTDINYYLLSSEYNGDRSNFKYDLENITNEVRSLLIKEENNTFKLVSYTYLPIREVQTLCPTYDCDFIESYEGSTIHVVYNDITNTWLVMTTSCLDIDKSKYASSLTHGDLFDECVVDRERFLSNLDITKSYIFILVHHKNKYLVDYTNKFGNNYKKLILTNVRDCYTFEENNINDYEILTEFNVYINNKSYTLKDVSSLLEEPYQNKMLSLEGFIFKDTKSVNNNLCKIRTKGYNEGLKRIPYFNDNRWDYIYAYLANNLEELLIFRGEPRDNIRTKINNIGNIITGLINVLNYLVIQFTKINMNPSSTQIYEKRNGDKYNELFKDNFTVYKNFIAKFQYFISYVLKDSDTNMRKVFLSELSLNTKRTLRRYIINDIMIMIDDYELLVNRIREIFTDHIFMNTYEKYIIEFKDLN